MEKIQCKICNKELTEQDIEKLSDYVHDKKNPKSEHFDCWMRIQLSQYNFNH